MRLQSQATNTFQNRKNPAKLVKQIITLFHFWGENHVRYRSLTSVKHQSAASEKHPTDQEQQPTVDAYDDADFSGDSEIQSYDGDSSQKEAKELHTFTKEELKQFEAVYKRMANSLTEVYKGFTFLEARVIVQAYCFCRNLPMGLRVARLPLRLVFDTLEAESKCKNCSPPNPVNISARSQF